MTNWKNTANKLYSIGDYESCLGMLYEHTAKAKMYVWGLILLSYILDAISFCLSNYAINHQNVAFAFAFAVAFAFAFAFAFAVAVAFAGAGAVAVAVAVAFAGAGAVAGTGAFAFAVAVAVAFAFAFADSIIKYICKKVLKR